MTSKLTKINRIQQKWKLKILIKESSKVWNHIQDCGGTYHVTNNTIFSVASANFKYILMMLNAIDWAANTWPELMCFFKHLFLAFTCIIQWERGQKVGERRRWDWERQWDGNWTRLPDAQQYHVSVHLPPKKVLS